MSEIDPSLPQSPEQDNKPISARRPAGSYAGRVISKMLLRKVAAEPEHYPDDSAPQVPENLRVYMETDELRHSPLPKINTLDLNGRDIEIQTAIGEKVSEADYVERFLEDMSDNPEYASNMQWLGEKELVNALAEQSKWLAGRVLAGETVAVVGESWHRDIKSGNFFTRLITDSANSMLSSLPSEGMGSIISDKELRQNANVAVDRVVLFDDWVGSGHDMGQRVSWTKDLMDEQGIAHNKLSVNLLAAHESLLRDGFDGYFADAKNEQRTRVIAPFEVEENNGGWYPPFSGIHSDMDYSFTFMDEMKAAVEKRAPENHHKSAYHIDSIDTLGNPDFYNRVQAGIGDELAK